MTRVQVYTSTEIREQLREHKGWVFRDVDWENAYRWSVEGRELSWAKHEDGTVFAVEILAP